MQATASVSTGATATATNGPSTTNGSGGSSGGSSGGTSGGSNGGSSGSVTITVKNQGISTVPLPFPLAIISAVVGLLFV